MSTSTQPATVPAPAKRSRRRRYLILIGLPLLVIAGLTGFYFYNGWAREQELQAVYAEIETDDPHWRWVDLLAHRPPLADDKNSMVQIRKVSKLLKKTPYNQPGKWSGESVQRALAVRNAKLSQDNADLLTPAFAALDPTLLAEARKLKELPDGRVVIDASVHPLDLLIEEATEARAVMNLLNDDIIRLAHEGRGDEAAQSCQALVNTAHAIGSHPTLIGQFVRYAGLALTAAAVERLLGQTEVSAAELARLQSLLELNADHDGLHQALRGERAWAHEVYTDLSSGRRSCVQLFGGVNASPALEHRLFDLFPGVLLSGYPDCLRLLTEQVQAARLKDEQRSGAFEAAEKKTRKIVEGHRNFFIRQFAPAVVKVVEADQRTQAQVRCALAGVAAERFRLAHERWPLDLDELVKAGYLKAALSDPWDGKPLRFKRTPTGVIIYSVGKDRVDDGGKIDRLNPMTANTDLGFELWAPSERAGPPIPEAAPNQQAGGPPPH